MNPDDKPQVNSGAQMNGADEQSHPENSTLGKISMLNLRTIYIEPDSLGGLVIKDNSGTPVLKINQNAFITAFSKAFAAASTQNGSFGDDWFMMYCETDSDGSGEVVGSFEMPSTNRMLIKRSGPAYGAVMRLVSVAGGAGYIDLFEPLILRTLSSDPASPQQGMIYFNTTSNKIKVYSGSGWETVTST